MLRPRLIVLATLLLAVAPASAADPKLESDDQKTLYAIGLALSRNVAAFSLSAEELALVQAGLNDGVAGDAKVEYDQFAPKIQELAKTRAAAIATEEKKAAEGFLAEAEKAEGAVKKASGLIFTEITAGSGASPKRTDQVKVHYEGRLRDGTVFDSSHKRGQPATFGLGGVIPCWTEGLQLMKVGGRSKLVCPAPIAYGDRGAPPLIKPGAALVFEVELLEIVKK